VCKKQKLIKQKQTTISKILNQEFAMVEEELKESLII